MNCPKCCGKIFDSCCVKCGYMTNGNTVSIKYKKDENEDIKLYQKNFDTMLHNNNWYIPFFVGPLYISYKGHVFIGTILTCLDLFTRYIILIIPSFLPSELLIIPFFNQLGIYTYFIYITVFKLISSATFNSMCLKLDKNKVNKIKKRYPKNYKNKIIKHTNHILYPTLTILFLTILLTILIIIRRIQNGTINDFLFWL